MRMRDEDKTRGQGQRESRIVIRGRQGQAYILQSRTETRKHCGGPRTKWNHHVTNGSESGEGTGVVVIERNSNYENEGGQCEIEEWRVFGSYQRKGKTTTRYERGRAAWQSKRGKLEIAASKYRRGERKDTNMEGVGLWKTEARIEEGTKGGGKGVGESQKGV